LTAFKVETFKENYNILKRKLVILDLFLTKFAARRLEMVQSYSQAFTHENYVAHLKKPSFISAKVESQYGMRPNKQNIGKWMVLWYNGDKEWKFKLKQ